MKRRRSPHSRRPHPDPEQRVRAAENALRHLRLALAAARRAGAQRTAERIRLALSSAYGAERNAVGRLYRGLRS